MNKLILILLGCTLTMIGYSQSGTKSRSAKSGQYVTKDYAKKNPSTTVVERNKSNKSSTRSTTSNNNSGATRKKK